MQERESVTYQKPNLLYYNELSFQKHLSVGAQERGSGRAWECRRFPGLPTLLFLPRLCIGGAPPVHPSTQAPGGRGHQTQGRSRSGCVPEDACTGQCTAHAHEAHFRRPDRDFSPVPRPLHKDKKYTRSCESKDSCKKAFRC